MALTVFNRLYRRLGRTYPVVFLTIELQSAFVITAATLGLSASTTTPRPTTT